MRSLSAPGSSVEVKIGMGSDELLITHCCGFDSVGSQLCVRAEIKVQFHFSDTVWEKVKPKRVYSVLSLCNPKDFFFFFFAASNFNHSQHHFSLPYTYFSEMFLSRTPTTTTTTTSRWHHAAPRSSDDGDSFHSDLQLQLFDLHPLR